MKTATSRHLKFRAKFKNKYEPYKETWFFHEIGGTYPSIDIWEQVTDWEASAGIKSQSEQELYMNDIVKDRFGRIMRIGYWRWKMCLIAISKTNFHHADFADWILDSRCTDFDNSNNVTELELIGHTVFNPELLTIPIP